MRATSAAFAERLLEWFDLHGRHNLPWQRQPTPYRVWVSEVMLQQTQVSTVIPYFERFLLHFPTVQDLAGAPVDEVMHLWTGLGYYARARNLQACAQAVMARHGGVFPLDLDSLVALPGIGRSTAGAILALSSDLRHPILDGNVKRVLARVFGIEGDPGAASVIAALWAASEACTPQARVGAYTQAIMDLGATVCTRSRPACTVCPMSTLCIAAREGRQAGLPGRRHRRERKVRQAVLLIAEAGGNESRAVLLERRPAPGIWGGLWSPPQFETEAAALEWCRRELGESGDGEPLAPIDHAFTHFDLRLQPIRVRCALSQVRSTPSQVRDAPSQVRDAPSQVRGAPSQAHGAPTEVRSAPGNAVREVDDRLWYRLDEPPRVGLPQPIRQLFERLRTQGGAAGGA